ncbi:MAG: DUF4962 domain-containing protein, partial [Muribaculaceae bacterium]|nr:DUF4962 domain-containing protein [Muribaculaceae bacterium]
MKYLFALAVVCCMFPACSDDTAIPDTTLPEPEELPVPHSQDEYHQKMRTVPYPRACNEIIINPAPLIVPEGMAGDGYIQFALSADPSFAENNTTLSEPVSWCFYNHHDALDTGRWYWRFRTIDSSG